MSPRGTPGHAVEVHIDGVPFYTFLQQQFDAATTRIWGVISFIEPNFTMPSGETFFAMVQRAAMRGVDVRLLFWHNLNFPSHHLFNDTHENRAMLYRCAPGVQVRWDHSPSKAHCHHQKAWLVDDTGMIGGMVMSHSTLANREHDPPNKHDIFSSFRGPLVAELEEHIALRWNHSRDPDKNTPFHALTTDAIALPEARHQEPAGDTRVALRRSIAPGLYGHQEGVTEIWEDYREAIQRAKEFIYIENQHPGEEAILGDLLAALERGVEVLYVVPGEPMMAITHERARYERVLQRQELPSRYTSTFRALAASGDFDNFTLAKLVVREREIYVHSKICIVDDCWMTIGSANLVDLSMCADHTELNLSVYEDRGLILGTLHDLLDEHTGQLGRSDERENTGARYVRYASAQARNNSAASKNGKATRGHLRALDPKRYPL